MRPGHGPNKVPARAHLLLLGLLSIGPARAESLVVSLSFNRLAVTSTYTGTSVAVFGAVERDGQAAARSGGYDVVVTIRGPRQSLTVREKEALGPVWVNRAQQKFAEVPSFLAVLSSRALPDLADEATRRRLRLGLSAIVAAPDLTLAAPVPDDPFREALLRLRRRERLFTETASGVRFLAPTVFRATAPLPATAPVGAYDVEVVLLAGGVPLARHEARFDLVKSGIEQGLADTARDWSLAYGLAVGALALISGWLASVIFRRD
ncbi:MULTISPECIES: TIGR02186 family protein [Methylobacterium]|uniref:Membrane protein n=2 Tax=Methylobacterium TaxID=407 RepID=A0A0C6FA07_9HYPH|nr:TIGR02186 family protein [Methylobacterium aquaticum]BAQ45243.1 membrane protein [Methylobacterium aquaticum]